MAYEKCCTTQTDSIEAPKKKCRQRVLKSDEIFSLTSYTRWFICERMQFFLLFTEHSKCTKIED